MQVVPARVPSVAEGPALLLAEEALGTASVASLSPDSVRQAATFPAAKPAAQPFSSADPWSGNASALSYGEATIGSNCLEGTDLAKVWRHQVNRLRCVHCECHCYWISLWQCVYPQLDSIALGQRMTNGLLYKNRCTVICARAHNLDMHEFT